MISSSGSDGDEESEMSGIVGGTADLHRGGDVGGPGGRLEFEHRNEIALEGERAIGEVEAAAEHLDPPAAHLERADRLRIGGRAGDPERAAELGVEPEAADEDRVVAVDGKVEVEAAAARAPRRRRAGPLERLHRRDEARLGVDVLDRDRRAAAKAVRKQDLGPAEVDPAADRAAAHHRAGQRQVGIEVGVDHQAVEIAAVPDADGEVGGEAARRIDGDGARDDQLAALGQAAGQRSRSAPSSRRSGCAR